MTKIIESISRAFGEEFKPDFRELKTDHVAIIGVDPGVTTGISVLVIDLNDGLPKPNDADKIRTWTHQISYGGSGNIKDVVEGGEWEEQEIAEAIGRLIMTVQAQYGEVYLVIEDFIIRKFLSTREFLSPVRLTSGILQDIKGRGTLPRDRIFFQSPSEAKGVCTDERLDRWGYTIKTQKDRHARDATRHAVLFLRRLSVSPNAGSRLK